jgi:hypothetical protein
MPLKLFETSKVIAYEEGEPDFFTLLTPEKDWIMRIHLNGKYTVEKQRLIIKEMANIVEFLDT